MSNLVRGHVFLEWQPLTSTVSNGAMEKATKEVSVDIRMCKNCTNTVFSRRDFTAALAQKTPDTKAYENLIQFERGIRLMLPKFQRLLLTLQ